MIGLEPNTYFVTITDANGCTTEGSVIIGSLTGTHDLSQDIPISISLNPHSGVFLLKMELQKEQTVRMEVYNLIGQKIGQKEIQGKSISESIDMTDLSIGQYLIKINTDIGLAIKWLVVTK